MIVGVGVVRDAFCMADAPQTRGVRQRLWPAASEGATYLGASATERGDLWLALRGERLVVEDHDRVVSLGDDLRGDDDLFNRVVARDVIHDIEHRFFDN
jgi:hypothetical protein